MCDDFILTMQDYYSRRAPFYDQSMGYDNPLAVDCQKPVIDFLVSSMADRDILEIACGPAFWTSYISQKAHSILATDFNESTLVEARKKIFQNNQVQFQVADAYSLPEFNSMFNAALAVDWFCHVPHIKRSLFLEGLHKKLYPKAIIIFCDQLPKAEESFSSKTQDHFQIRSLTDGSKYQVIKNFPTQQEVMDIFEPFQLTLSTSHSPQLAAGL